MILPGVAAGVPVLQTGTLVVQDDFVDTDGTTLDAHAISPVNTNGDSWAKPAPLSFGFNITSNRAVADDGAAICVERIYNGGYADAIVKIDALTEYSTGTDYGIIGIGLRVVDEYNLAYVVIDPSSSGSELQLRQNDAGADSLISSAGVPEVYQTDNVAFTLEATVSGLDVNVSLTVGASSYSTSGTISSNLTEPAHGLYHNGAGTYTLRGVETFYLSI